MFLGYTPQEDRLRTSRSEVASWRQIGDHAPWNVRRWPAGIGARTGGSIHVNLLKQVGTIVGIIVLLVVGAFLMAYKFHVFDVTGWSTRLTTLPQLPQ